MTARALAGLGVCAALLVPARPAAALQGLDAFLAAGRVHNLDRRERAAIAAQRDRERAATRRARLPVLTLRGAYAFNQHDAIVALPLGGGASSTTTLTRRHELDAYAALDVALIDPVRRARIRAADAAAAAAAARVDATALDVDLLIARAYFDVVAGHALIAAARTAIAAAEADLAIAERRAAGGLAGEADVARAAAAAASRRGDERAAAAELAIAERRLASLTGVAPTADAPPALRDDLRAEPPLAAFTGGVAPRERAAAHDVAAQARAVDQVAAQRLPALELGLRERLTNATGFADQRASFQAQLALTWRFDAAVPAQLAAQRAGLGAAKLRYARERQQRADDVHAAWHRVDAQRAACRAANREQRAAELARDAARRSLAAGTATPRELADAERDAFAAAARRIEAYGDLAYARAALRIAAGAPLDGGAP